MAVIHLHYVWHWNYIYRPLTFYSNHGVTLGQYQNIMKFAFTQKLKACSENTKNLGHFYTHTKKLTPYKSVSTWK